MERMPETRGEWVKESELGNVRFVRHQLAINGVATTWIKDLRWLQESRVDVLPHINAARTITREWEDGEFRDEVEYEATYTDGNLRKTVTLVAEPTDGNYIICSLTNEVTQAHLSIDYENDTIESIDFLSDSTLKEPEVSGEFETLWSLSEQESTFYRVRFEFPDIFDDLVAVKVTDTDHNVVSEEVLPFGEIFRFQGTTYTVRNDTNDGVVFDISKKDEKIFDVVIPRHISEKAIADAITTQESSGWEDALWMWDINAR